jgi:hypothetical protein
MARSRGLGDVYKRQVLAFGISGMFWVFAKVSAKDSIRDVRGYALIGNAITSMHIWSKTVLFFLMVIPSGVLLLNDTIRMYYTETFNWFFVVKYVIIYMIWQYVFEKILPDSPEVGGGVGSQRGAGNYPQLGR